MDILSPRKENKQKLDILATAKKKQNWTPQEGWWLQKFLRQNCILYTCHLLNHTVLRSTYWLSFTQIPEALHKRPSRSWRQWDPSSRSDYKALSYRFSFQWHVWIIIPSLICLNTFRAVISHETYGKGPQYKVLTVLYLIPLNSFWPTVEIICIGTEWKELIA